MNWKFLWHGLLAGLVMNIIGFLVNSLMNAIWPHLQEAYMNTYIFRPWGDPLMSLFFLYPFVLGVIFAYGWDHVKKLRKTKDYWKNGIFIGSLWTVFTIPGMLINYSSFQVSFLMVFTWLLMGFFQYVSGGIVVARFNRK